MRPILPDCLVELFAEEGVDIYPGRVYNGIEKSGRVRQFGAEYIVGGNPTR